MAQRTITVNLDRADGKTTITVLNGESRGIGRVTIQEIDADEQTGTRWEVRGGGDRVLHRYSTLETAFRNAMLSAVQVVTEDLLPTKPY